jgi:hypothetical protein
MWVCKPCGRLGATRLCREPHERERERERKEEEDAEERGRKRKRN